MTRITISKHAQQPLHKRKMWRMLFVESSKSASRHEWPEHRTRSVRLTKPPRNEQESPLSPGWPERPPLLEVVAAVAAGAAPGGANLGQLACVNSHIVSPMPAEIACLYACKRYLSTSHLRDASVEGNGSGAGSDSPGSSRSARSPRAAASRPCAA
jgi:hypothetical protein